MPFADSSTPSTLTFPQHILERAERSLVCSPFNFALFDAMRRDRVAMNAVTGNDGVSNGYTKYPISELAADNALAWLIQVGVLRREVDGQGITDSFRLTPLGRRLVEQCQSQNWRNSTLSDRINDTITRWLRLPF
ncbi:Npun_F0494 family protein [Calothrix sp. PCC 6303]|uniref:Npun_F0494 family protein n=1 Tax=Calothrix sp. PCC 6303 TaxID=1170562 RepID=UPI0002A01E8F|nr:Npun_F0494 family protein [Calothrix sp. PCC 6303]AFZ00129.1 hypothetical protein Cal6303_1066 [Calothrix sp. PCC 6303]